MESNSGPKLSGFGVLLRRLLEIVNLRIDNGEFTERGLARLIGVSQPQVHNILKGARNLSPETADLLLGTLHLSILDLIEHGDPPVDAVWANATALSLIPRKPPAKEVGRGAIPNVTKAC